ncbi:MAG: hypothetical protein FJ139_11800 [Deltaproteobacteria bacterium]|nr:hypothetical protein [Deltaproteobacteria bacterium]
MKQSSVKSFKEQNYYELLEISPDALPLEIRRAYKESLELYTDNSISSYSFFSKEERGEIISRLEEAYLTLMNPASRAEYDRRLIELGILEEGNQYRDRTKEPIPIYRFKKSRTDMFRRRNASENLTDRVSQSPLIQEILTRETLRGEDLKRIRLELGVTLESIAEETNVRIGVLQAIEEDRIELLPPMVYLKGFLKSYARYIQVDEHIIVSGYIKRFEEGD